MLYIKGNTNEINFLEDDFEGDFADNFEEEMSYFGLHQVEEEAEGFTEDVYGQPEEDDDYTESAVPAHVAGWTIRKNVQLLKAGADVISTTARLFRSVGGVNPENTEIRKNLKKIGKELTARATVDDLDTLLGVAPSGWETFLAGIRQELFWAELIDEEKTLPKNGVSRKEDLSRKPAKAS